MHVACLPSFPPFLPSFLSSRGLTRLQDWCTVKAWDDGDTVSEQKLCLFLNTEVIGRESRARGYAARRKRKLADRRARLGRAEKRRKGKCRAEEEIASTPPQAQIRTRTATVRRRRSAGVTTMSPWAPPARTSATRASTSSTGSTMPTSGPVRTTTTLTRPRCSGRWSASPSSNRCVNAVTELWREQRRGHRPHRDREVLGLGPAG
jgi:hypothetical protein